MGLRSERPGITGAMEPSMSWNPWFCPVVRVAVEIQECTQIDENATLKPFWCIRVHYFIVTDRRGDKGVYTD